MRIAAPEAVFWVCGTTLLITVMDSFVETISPTMIPTGQGWRVLLDTPHDRSRWTGIESLLGPGSIIENAFWILTSALVTVAFVWILTRKQRRRRGFRRLYFCFIVPLCVSLLLDELCDLILFELAYSEAISNILFLVIWVGFGLLGIYLTFVIPIAALKAIARIRCGRAIAATILAEICLFAVLLLSPVEALRDAFSRDVGKERRAVLDEKSVESFRKREIDHAIELVDEALQLSPQSLHFRLKKAALLYVRLVDGEDGLIEVAKNTSPEPKVTESVVERYDEYVRYLQKFSQDFPDDAAVQIYVAGRLSLVGECEQAQVCYSVAGRLPHALPHERVIAANALVTFRNPSLETRRALRDTIWHSNDLIESLIMIPRFSEATFVPVYGDVLIDDLLTGQDNIKKLLPMLPANSEVSSCDPDYGISAIISGLRVNAAKKNLQESR